MTVGSAIQHLESRSRRDFRQDSEQAPGWSSDFAGAVEAGAPIEAFDEISSRPHGSRMKFEIVGELSHVETFASGYGIRELARLRKTYGRGRWRKRKGIARVRLPDGSIRLAEIHWYEAATWGRKELKIKRLL
jgi:hypothetical protein